MSTIFAFFWLLFFEFIPNFFGVITISVLLFKKLLLRDYRVWIGSLIGSFLCTGTIVLLENTKLNVTTLPVTTSGSFLDLSVFALVIALAMLAVLSYYRAGWSSLRSDLIVGILLALAISGYEFYAALQLGDIAVASWARLISHTAAFLVSFPLTLSLIRKAGVSKTFGEFFAKSIFATLVMSVIIVAIDYMPFVK